MELPVIASRPPHNVELLPARMCNELVYCDRLFHLEHVQGVFAESADPIEDTSQHNRSSQRRVRASNRSPEASDASDPPWPEPRSLTFSAPKIGVTGTVEFVELGKGEALVVYAKRGEAPSADDHEWKEHTFSHGVWPSDVAQLAMNMAMLRENGMVCNEAHIHYRKSGTTRVVQWSADLERFAYAVIAQARQVERRQQPPLPLLDSPKCVGCSLQDVCLPDEHHAMLQLERTDASARKIAPPQDDKAILHLNSPGMVLRKRGNNLVACFRDGTKQVYPVHEVRHVAAYGPANITQPCVAHLLRSGVLISHHTSAGRLMGLTQPLTTLNIALRRAQYRATDNEYRRLQAARAWVAAKIVNQRTMLRRYRKGAARPAGARAEIELALRSMKVSHDAVLGAIEIDTIRGHESDAATRYFDVLPSILPEQWRGEFEKRTPKPARDRVNALLNFGYSLLVRDATASLGRVGLDPMLGMLHEVRAGRTSLAFDVIEPFRAAWVDAAMIRLITTNGIDPSHFHVSQAGVSLTANGRRRVIRAYDRRADEFVTHPRFGYRASIRRMLDVDVRMLAKWLLGEIPEFRPFSRR